MAGKSSRVMSSTGESRKKCLEHTGEMQKIVHAKFMHLAGYSSAMMKNEYKQLKKYDWFSLPVFCFDCDLYIY